MSKGESKKMKGIKRKNYKTLEDLEKIEGEFLVPTDVAGYLGCAANSINCHLLAGKEFPFPAYLFGDKNYVKIPKRAFIEYHKSHALTNSIPDNDIKPLLTKILEDDEALTLLSNILSKIKKSNKKSGDDK